MMEDSVIQGTIKTNMMKEALASCQIEGIGLDLTLEDLYLAELKIYRSEKKKRQLQECSFLTGKLEEGK